MASRPATSVAERVACSPAGTRPWSMRAPMPMAAAISRHTAIAAGASWPARTTPSASYSSGSSTGSRRVDVTDLEQGDAGAAMRLVEGDGAQQARPQRRAQHALLGDEWVGDAQGVAVEAGHRQRVRRQERVRHGLGDAQPEQHGAQLATPLLGHRQPAVQRRAGHDLTDAVVAVHPGDLFDDVDLLGAVGAPRGDRHGPHVATARHGEPDRVEQRREVVGTERCAEDPVDRADAHRARAVGRRERSAARVDRTGVDDEFGARLGEQLDEAGDRRVDPVRVDAALEPHRRLRAQAEAGDALADRQRRRTTPSPTPPSSWPR